MVHPANPRQGGFTLVEVLLATVLVSLILTMAYSGLRTGSRAVDRGEAVVERTNHLRIVHQFIRQQLSDAMPLQLPAENEIEDDEVVFFEGDDQWVHFAGPMPGHLSSGGTYEQSLYFDRGPGGLELLFDHAILKPDEDWPEAEEREPIVLLGGIRRGRFAYMGLDDEGLPDDWVDEWEDPQVMPLMIRVEIELDESTRLTWPALVIRPRLDGAVERPTFTRPFVLPNDPRRKNGGG